MGIKCSAQRLGVPDDTMTNPTINVACLLLYSMNAKETTCEFGTKMSGFLED